MAIYPKSPKYPNVEYIGFYVGNRNSDFGNILCIWVLGPVGIGICRQGQNCLQDCV